MFLVLCSVLFSIIVSDESGALFIHSCLEVYILGKDPLYCGNPDLQLFLQLLFFCDVISGILTFPPQPSSELIAAMNMMLITWLFPFLLVINRKLQSGFMVQEFLPVSPEWFKTHCTLDNYILASNSLLPWFWLIFGLNLVRPSFLSAAGHNLCCLPVCGRDSCTFVLFVALFTDQTRRWSQTSSQTKI